MTAKLIRDLPFPDYLALPGYGSSDLRAFRIGPPCLVPWKRANRHNGTDATRIGTAAHCRILTPELFARQWVARPSDERGDFRTKLGKAWRDERTAEGLGILDAEEWQSIESIARAVVSKLGKAPSNTEQTIVWEQDGLPLKSRPDWFDHEAVYDLKVSRVADREFRDVTFGAYAQGWMHQLAHGRTALAAIGHEVKMGRLVIVSPNAPHIVHLLEVRENDMDFLELHNADTRRGMAECHRTGHWPGTPDKWQTIELPASAAFTESDLEGAEEALPL